MSIFQSTLALQIIFITAILNLLLLLAISFSCRCVPVFGKLGNRLMSYRSFQRFYKLHCYFWPIFWVSVIVHMVFALVLIGIPF